jgi:probable rRNA maturation factor
MTISSGTGPVTVELQNATDESDLPDHVDWSRWVSVALELADEDIEDGLEEGIDSAFALTVRLVGNDESQQLNSDYRNKQGATNVLAFAGPQGAAQAPGQDRELGDVVICLPVVYREASDQGKRASAHLAHMAVHGTLHLLGFSHEDESAADRMERLETQILTRLGFPNPYATN